MPRDLNPFRVSGRLPREDMIDRDSETGELLDLAEGGHSARVVAPRRYGKTSLLARVLDEAADAGMPTAHVDLLDVLTLPAIVTRIERAYSAGLRGGLRRTVEAILRSWDLGVSLGGGGFALAMRTSPRLDAESVLLKLLELPTRIAAKTGVRTIVVFDEIQDVLNVDGADGIIRSVVQYQSEDASYLFAGSSPSMMARLFDDPSRPLLEHALPVELRPLPRAETAEFLEERFRRTGREIGEALDPLLDFARGHPQRTMLLAHHLWAGTPRGSAADEAAWVEALTRALRGSAPLLAARWRSLPLNEQRVALALATGRGSVYDAHVYESVGLKRGSIRFTLEAIEGRGEVIRTDAGPRLTDPLFEHWLEERGVL